MILEQTITLDLLPGEHYPVIRAKQGDGATRFLRVDITRGGEPFALPAGIQAEFRCLKADGHSCLNPAVVNSDGTVTAELTEQVLAVPGTVWADICLAGEDGEVLSTLSFQIRVDPVPLGLNLESDTELLRLKDLIRAAESVKDGASAYEIARAHGFAGSEAAWLASLKGADGYTPVKGQDYFTEADRKELVTQILSELEIWEGGSY